MFLTQNLPMLIKGVTLKQNEDGERFAYCKLVLEPFFEELARELGDEVADHPVRPRTPAAGVVAVSDVWGAAGGAGGDL